MKRVYLTVILLSLFVSNAQESSSSRVNEVKVNFLNIISIASVEVGYERFFGDDQSVGLDLMINDRFSFLAEGNDGKEFKTSSVALSYNFYFSDSKPGAGYFITPYFKYRIGDYVEVPLINGVRVETTTNISSPILGLGMGYKWLWAEKFTVSANASIGRNFNKDVEKIFWAIEPTAAINIGYRF